MWVVKGARAGSEVGGTDPGTNTGEAWKLVVLSWRDVGGMRGVEVKCIDIAQNSD